MNTKNNKRKRESKESIEKTFVELLQTKELSEITVSDICKRTGLNRTTFYASYVDIYDLADTIRKDLEKDIEDLYRDEVEKGYNSNDFLPIFKNIKENQLFYRTYFKLGYDKQPMITRYDTDLAQKHFGNKLIDYHIEFFRSGLNAIIQKWLKNGCQETPEEMFEVIKSEYSVR